MTAMIHALPACRSAAARTRRGSASPTLQSWLETQTRLVAAWRDGLVAQSGDVRLIALLDQHAAFLEEAREAFEHPPARPA